MARSPPCCRAIAYSASGSGGGRWWGAQRRSNPGVARGTLDRFAALAMTVLVGADVPMPASRISVCSTARGRRAGYCQTGRTASLMRRKSAIRSGTNLAGSRPKGRLQDSCGGRKAAAGRTGVLRAPQSMARSSQVDPITAAPPARRASTIGSRRPLRWMCSLPSHRQPPISSPSNSISLHRLCSFAGTPAWMKSSCTRPASGNGSPSSSPCRMHSSRYIAAKPIGTNASSNRVCAASSKGVVTGGPLRRHHGS